VTRAIAPTLVKPLQPAVTRRTRRNPTAAPTPHSVTGPGRALIIGDVAFSGDATFCRYGSAGQRVDGIPPALALAALYFIDLAVTRSTWALRALRHGS